MSYLSLYRKYRSQKFAELSGQEHVTVTLQNSVRAERIAHAYLFCGPRGTGKTSTARLLAKALNCEQAPSPEPCDVCLSCEQIRAGISLDVLEIDAASHRGIDDVRALREQVIYHPVQGRYRIYVIDEVHMLTGEAFNALLKTLEEPPGHVVFILATTEAHKIPATILSRCQRFDFRRASLPQLRERLQEVAAAEGIEIEPQAVALLARHAGGSWRDGLGLLEQTIAFTGGAVTAGDVRAVLGLVEEEAIFDLVEAVRTGDTGALFRLLEEAIAAGKDPRQLLHDLTEQFRDLLLRAAGANPESGEVGAEALNQQAAAFGVARLADAVERLATGEKELRWSQQSRLLLEVLLVGLAQGRGVAPLPGPQAAKPAEHSQAGEPRPPETPGPTAPAPRRVAARDQTAPSAPSRGSGAERPAPLSAGDSRAGVEDDEANLAALFPEHVREDQPPGPPAPAPPEGSRSPAGKPAEHSQAGRPAPRGAAPQVPDTDYDPYQVDETPPAPAVRQGEGGELERVRGKWRLVHEELKRARKMSLHGLLAAASPVGLEGGELTLEFPTQALADLFAQKQGAEPETLPSVIRDICGVSCRLRIATKGDASSQATPAGKAGASPAADRPVIDQPGSEPTGAAGTETERAPGQSPQRELTREVLELFNGTIVDDLT